MAFTFEEFLNWEEADYDSIKVKRIYIDIAEDLVAGILLSQIVYWYLPSKRNGNAKLRVKKGDELWLAKGRDDWWDECRITSRQFDRAINILVDKGIVEKKLFRFNGSPMVHVRLIPDNLMEHINAILNAEKQQGMDFNETVKSNLTKSENGTLQNVKMEINEKLKSITEITTKNTTKTTTNRKDSVVPYEKIVELYNDICISLPKVKALSNKRKEKIKTTYKEVGSIEAFEEVFRKAEKSPFLSGRNGKWGGCNFDWLINYNNFLKVLEGTYDEKNKDASFRDQMYKPFAKDVFGDDGDSTADSNNQSWW